MKPVPLLMLAVFCALGSGDACAEAGRSNRPGQMGGGYVTLEDWAQKNNFSGHWLRAGQTLQLSSRTTSMVFEKDSREAELDGVRICLSYPMILRGGTACISQADLDTAIYPLLYPQRNSSGKKVKNIVIDPGHGGKDPGNIDGAHAEKTYTLLLAQELRDRLNRSGFNATLTRTGDTFVDLPARPDIARRHGADLFISLHWNSLKTDRSVKGAQIFCLTPAGASSSNAGGSLIGAGWSPGNKYDKKNMLLAYLLQKSLLHEVGVEDHGVRRGRLWVLRVAEMPAVLIEGGFMSNSSEARKIYDAAYRQQMAKAIVDGVMAYKHEVEN
jgi:N-acetylmuramoyl-L-alanine amidase